MIYTVTLNPALDTEVYIDSFEFNAVVRSSAPLEHCGGKGFNVSRLLANFGADSVAMGFVGGSVGIKLEQLLLDGGIRTLFTKVAGETRTNVVITERAGEERHLKVNQPGPRIEGDELGNFLDQVMSVAQKDDIWVLAGSLPKGVPHSIYADIARSLGHGGCKVIIDASGDALVQAIAAKPFLIKPNLEELEDLEQRSLARDDDIAESVRCLINRGVQNVCVSLGSRGVYLAGSDVGPPQFLSAPKIVQRNPTGAGDSLVGGTAFKLAHGAPLVDAVKFGLVCGSATASLPGTELAKPELVNKLIAENALG